jgi:mRNA-degrading endonuclease RelE of RelBE toxin-antitoxin system
MDWELIIDKVVKKQLRKIQNEAGKIIFVAETLPANPYAGDIKRMEGEKDVWRRRIGSYRIYYEVLTKEKTINVFDVKRKTS